MLQEKNTQHSKELPKIFIGRLDSQNFFTKNDIDYTVEKRYLYFFGLKFYFLPKVKIWS